MTTLPSPDPQTPPPLAIVTGASRRLGRAIALELAGQGLAIGLHYHRSASQAQETAAEIRGSGIPVFLLQADLADPGQIEAMFRQVAALPYRLKVLVNAAAVMPRADILTIPAEEWDQTLALNLRAPLLCAQAAARLMTRQGQGGLIVNISDTGARKTWTGFPAYTVSKAALETLTQLLARKLAPGIRVNAVAPGLILPSETTSAAEWERLTARVPLGRAGSPEEVAQAVAFLLHNEYITGQTIVVDGGYQIV